MSSMTAMTSPISRAVTVVMFWMENTARRMFSVAAAVLFSAHSGLFQVAAIWGIGVTLAIYATRHLSCAHLNPAVSLAMVIGRRMTPSKLPAYLGGQFVGAFIAACLLYSLFGAKGEKRNKSQLLDFYYALKPKAICVSIAVGVLATKTD